MKLSDLKPNPGNPRTMTEDKLSQFKKTLKRFGDISGVVYNRQTKQIVGGHQRQKGLPKDSEIHITKTYGKRTRTGTIRVGYILVDGERFNYREVDWDGTTEKAANIAANRGAGDWDSDKLSEWMKELEESEMDLEFTLFDDEEREAFLTKDFEPGSSGDQATLDKKRMASCPACGEEFVVGKR